MKIVMRKMPLTTARGSIRGALPEDTALFKSVHVSAPSFSYQLFEAGNVRMPTL